MVTGQVSKLVGARVKRKEDPRFLVGDGKYTDDVQLRGMTYLTVLRSPHAHALIKGIDVSAAAEHPEVLAVVTGREIRETSQAPFPLFAPLEGMKMKERWPIATEKATFVGEPVAAVLALSPEASEDARQLIEVDYEPLPPVVDMEKAVQEDSPLVHEELGTNLCYADSGASGEPERAFLEAGGVVSARLTQPRNSDGNPDSPQAVVFLTSIIDVI